MQVVLIDIISLLMFKPNHDDTSSVLKMVASSVFGNGFEKIKLSYKGVFQEAPDCTRIGSDSG